MSSNAHYFKIGIFVLAGFFLLAGALVYLGAGRMFRPRIYVETYVDGTVQGVDIGSPVKFRGVPIGRITHIDFTFNEYDEPEADVSGRQDYVVLVMEVDRQAFRGMFEDPELKSDVDDAVEQGLRVMIQPQGITGLNFAEFDYLPPAKRTPPLKIWWTPHHPYIPSAPGTLTSMLDSVNSIMDTFKVLDIKDAMTQLHTALEAANATLKKLEGTMDDIQLGKIGADLRGLIADLKAKVDKLPVEELSTDGRKALDSITAAAAEAGKMSAEAQVLVDKLETNPLLNPDEVGAIVGDFKAAAANVRVLTENLREYPSQLILGEPPKRSPFDPASKTKQPRR